MFDKNCPADIFSQKTFYAKFDKNFPGGISKYILYFCKSGTHICVNNFKVIKDFDSKFSENTRNKWYNAKMQ